MASEWLQNTFMHIISNVGSVLMILTPWDQPITLTRAWCVYELYVCAQIKSAFHIALPPTEQTRFRDSLQKDPQIFYQTFVQVKSEKAQATKIEDLLAIQKAVRDSVGFRTLDGMVLSLLTQWMEIRLQSHIRAAADNGDSIGEATWQICLGHFF
ncbi:Kinesin light chain 3 [Rhizophlyctis rosea]|nr:Kinesin light chain 3 [Rhizophlyctis rosea]